MKKQTEVFIEKFQRFEKLLKQTTGSGDAMRFRDSLAKAGSQKCRMC
jgi:hypothetical protein